MATSDINGLPQFQGSDPAVLDTSLNLLSAKTSDALNQNVRPFIVPNQSSRNTLATTRTPSKSNPLLVWLQDTGKFELNDGTGWAEWPPPPIEPQPNEIVIAGVTYQRTGVLNVSMSSVPWRGRNPFWLTMPITFPYKPPTGWCFSITPHSIASFTGMLGFAGNKGTEQTNSIFWGSNHSAATLTSLAWQLVKL